MAKEILIRFIDDLDGTSSDAVETARFALDGVAYEIDLAPKNMNSLRERLSEFVANARRTDGRANHKPAGDQHGEAPTKTIRQWAQQNGYGLGDRGRIPKNVLDAFNEAHR